MKNGAMVERALEEARQGLLGGDAAGLGLAADALVRVEAGMRNPRGATPGQLQGIQRRVRRLECLLEASRAFHEGLARIASAVDDAVANYTRQGAPSALSNATDSSVNLHG